MASQSTNDEKAFSQPPRPRRNGKPAFPRPKNIIDRSRIPPARNISTQNTQETNDPLWKDSFIIDGEAGFTVEAPIREFSPDASGFVTLVESEYSAIVDVDKQYGKSVSASAHAYYHGVLYWYELALIAQKRGLANNDQVNLIHFVDGYPSAQIAAGAAEYLEGLGDFTDATGVKHILASQTPNGNGHFGQITHASHQLYETLPAPAILLQRCREDLDATVAHVPRDNWCPANIRPRAINIVPRDPPAPRPVQAFDLVPDELVDEDLAADAEEPAPPEEAPLNLPTSNLLGWRRSAVLSVNQLQELSNILPEAGIVNGAFAVCRELFEFVERRLRECKRYKLSPIPKTTAGSIAQQVTWHPSEPTLNRFAHFTTAPGQCSSRTALPVRVATAARVMCYRAVRRELLNPDNDIVHTWSCFNYDRYLNVPQNWRANRNAIIQQGMNGLIDGNPFKTSVCSRMDTLHEYLSKFKTH